ncbi:hypothetical protein X744_16920 [Mesorhizobium sp. LNJC372A00]|nr:hypothetical protein X745_22405 [Mesorhizobium sp. LNJC374B00]ESY58752.1 hypothetical protein X744_16920 [Mesorhizobium sp. LNJC372A00]
MLLMGSLDEHGGFSCRYMSMKTGPEIAAVSIAPSAPHAITVPVYMKKIPAGTESGTVLTMIATRRFAWPQI